jgi:hypothetical protein
MASTLDLRHTIHCDEDTYWWKIVFDEAFNKAMYVDHMKFLDWSVLDSRQDDDKLVRRVRVEPKVGDLPGPVKKVLGDRLSYVEEGTLDKKSRRYRIHVVPSALPDKTKIDGEMWCEKGASDKEVVRHARFTVEVKVLMVGKLVEDRILGDLRKSYEDGTVFTNDYIKKNSL